MPRSCSLVLPERWALWQAKRVLTPLRFGSVRVERHFSRYAAQATWTATWRFHWFSMVQLILVTLITYYSGGPATLLLLPLAIAAASAVIIGISAVLPQSARLLAEGTSAAYIVAHLELLIMWRNTMVPIWAAQAAPLGAMRGLRAAFRTSAPLLITHIILMLGVHVPMHVHVPLHVLVFARHAHNYAPLCQAIPWLPRSLEGPVSFIPRTFIPAMWAATAPAHCGSRPAVPGAGGASPDPACDGGCAPTCLSDALAVSSCSTVLSGLWLVAMVLGTVLVALLELVQRRAFLMQSNPLLRRNAVNWPMDDEEYIDQAVPHALTSFFLLLIGLWNVYMFPVAVLLATLVSTS